MKLFYTPIPLFAHKTLITAHEAGVWDRSEPVAVFPFRPGYDITQINPLGKVPTLVLGDGGVLYGSQAIVEYLDSLAPGGRALYPEPGPARWYALRRLALADILFETTTQLTTDDDYSDAPRPKFLSWLWPKVERCIETMNEDAKTEHLFDIGDAAAIHALTYLDVCVPDYVPEQIPRDYNWRKGHKRLESWFENVMKRPSVQFHFQHPYTGDETPENCAAKVDEVLRLQKLP